MDIETLGSLEKADLSFCANEMVTMTGSVAIPPFSAKISKNNYKTFWQYKISLFCTFFFKAFTHLQLKGSGWIPGPNSAQCDTVWFPQLGWEGSCWCKGNISGKVLRNWVWNLLCNNILYHKAPDRWVCGKVMKLCTLTIHEIWESSNLSPQLVRRGWLQPPSLPESRSKTRSLSQT